jgi:hypothetical protein
VFGGGADCISSRSSMVLGVGLGAFGASSSYGLVASFGLGPELSRRTLSGTIIRDTIKAPKSQLVTPISTKLQRPDGCD